MALDRYGVIEITAHEVRMKVYELSVRNGIRIVESFRRGVPIGQDTYVDGKISPPVLDQLCAILNGFHRVEKEYRTQRTQVIATSAVREAKNCAMVISQIRVRTGYEVEAMSNAEQRFLRLKAVASQSSVYPVLEKGSLLVDVGTGSLQVSIFEKMVLMTTQNISLGIAKIADMFSEASGDTAYVEGMIQELINNDVHTFEKMFLKEREIRNIIIVGDGATSFIRHRVNRLQQEQQISTMDALKILCQQLSGLASWQISRSMEIPIEYVGMLTPMVIIYQAFLETTHVEAVYLPEADLCDGVMLDYAEHKGVVKPKHDFNEDILAASRNISRRYMGNRKHAQMVETMVCRIFDTLKSYHGLGKRERLLLQISAILHDCGKFISMSAPAECAYRIIMATEILGLSQVEREMVANIVRYNTLAMPSYDDLEAKLTEEEYLKVVKLTAILRVGNGLDRSHRQKFQDMKLALKDSSLVITTMYPGDITLERTTVEKQEQEFEETYGLKLVIRQKKPKQ